MQLDESKKTLVDKVHQQGSEYSLNLEDAEYLLRCVATSLSKYNIEWLLGFGTILGIYRDGSLIPYDTDVDILSFVEHEASITTKVVDDLKQYQITPIRYIEGAIISFAYNEVYLDVYLYRAVDDMFVMGEQEQLKVPKKYLKPLYTVIDWKGCQWPAPYPIENYLEHHYGNDWKLPIKNKHAQH